MSLLKSISGIRGLVDHKIINQKKLDESQYLSKFFIEKITLCISIWLKNKKYQSSIIIGRDPRNSGIDVKNVIKRTFKKNGIHVLDLDITTTPTLAFLSKNKNKVCIMITASHNPIEWNGIKVFAEGRNLTQQDWEEIYDIEKNIDTNKANKTHIPSILEDKSEITVQSALSDHLSAIIKCRYIDQDLIKKKNLRVGIDAVNLENLYPLKELLKKLGVKYIYEHKYPNNSKEFKRNPEPTSKNLEEFGTFLKNNKLDIGLAIDPDVDRLSIVNEKGEAVSEEFTLILCADMILSQTKGSFVVNNSSSLINKLIAKKHNIKIYETKVGESNVVDAMLEKNALIGGEGNGGVILKEINLCRDALLASGLILTLRAKSDKKISEVISAYPQTFFRKKSIKIDRKFAKDIELYIKNIIEKIKTSQFLKNKDIKISTKDGTKIDFKDGWIGIRKSNTEPIIRVFIETMDKKTLDEIFERLENI